ncbi:MAG: family 43 glycosylhydrolase [Tannerellaceae bacterium]|nr:family 43 glycosylhydrolase [Tannerellaceae bacterium]
MKKLATLFAVCAFVFLAAGCSSSQKQPLEIKSLTRVNNPFLPGYYADPSLVEKDGTYYLYVTSDPWGTDFLACWTSDDFVNWTFHALNWPTKEACTSPDSGGSMVWAPSVIERDGFYYMYVSVGAEVWCGKASHPLGPWENPLGDQPMIPYDKTGYYHVIDAEAFRDDDGRYYLYWGSGWNWVNGHCFAAELAEDMSSFKDEPREVTPANYFEAPLMVKKDGVYYLTYSDGITMDDTYKVRYAVGDNPYGPFTEADNSPVLEAHPEKQVYGPGHHTVAQIGEELYILYHKHRLPYVEGTAYRQSCMDPFVINTEKKIIENIDPSNSVVIDLPATSQPRTINVKEVRASSEKESWCARSKVLDKSYQTLWYPAAGDESPWIELALTEPREVKEIVMRFEYAWKEYAFDCEISLDGQAWTPLYQNSGEKWVGSPVIIPVEDRDCQFVRFIFRNSEVGIFTIDLVE